MKGGSESACVFNSKCKRGRGAGLPTPTNSVSDVMSTAKLAFVQVDIAMTAATKKKKEEQQEQQGGEEARGSFNTMSRLQHKGK